MKSTGIVVSKELVLINSSCALVTKVLNATALISLHQDLVKCVDAFHRRPATEDC